MSVSQGTGDLCEGHPGGPTFEPCVVAGAVIVADIIRVAYVWIRSRLGGSRSEHFIAPKTCTVEVV